MSNPSLNGASRRPKKAKTQSLSRVFEAADRADFRGYFYFPQLTPTIQMDRYSVRTLCERSDWLYKNIGAVGMAIDGPALDEVGTGLWPKWTTGQADFDKALTDAYHYANHDPRTFSADGLQDCYSAQFAVRRSIALYRDCFGQLLRPMPGRILPSMHILPGYIVGNTPKQVGEDNQGWIDGVRSDEYGRPLQYQILDKENGDKGTPIEADDLLHFHEPFLPGQQRGTGALWSVAKRLFRREDVLAAMEDGLLSREQIGYAVESAAGTSGGPRFVPPGGGAVEEFKNDDGSKYTVVRFPAGVGRTERTVQVPTLEPGQTIKTVESNRPSSEGTGFLDSILREVAWARRYPPEYIFFHAGMTQGTAVRSVNQRVKNIHNGAREFQLIPQFLHRWHVFFAWQYIKGGVLQARGMKIPPNWWQHKIIRPPDSSVDLRGEGQLYDRRVSENKMSIESYHGLAGEDASDVEDENLAVIDRRLQKLEALNKARGTKLTYFDVWPRTQSAPLSAGTVGGTDGDEAGGEEE